MLPKMVERAYSVFVIAVFNNLAVFFLRLNAYLSDINSKKVKLIFFYVNVFVNCVW